MYALVTTLREYDHIRRLNKLNQEEYFNIISYSIKYMI